MTTPKQAKPSVTRRHLLTLALTAPVVPVLATLPGAQAEARRRPVRPRVRRLQLDRSTLRPATAPGSAGRAGRRVYTTGQVATEPFRVAALTWHGGSSEAVMRIRTRERGGWSRWFTLHDDGHGPEPGSPEARTARPGTDPIVVAESDGVEVWVDAPGDALPADLRVELIDPGRSDADHDPTGLRNAAQTSGLTRPVVLSRADWGADESLRHDETTYGEVRGTFVHHTAGTNNYTESDVPAIIRGIYAFHVESRGWWDIGYNFLIDKFGRIWEGRYGGITKAPIGAHTLGYNSYAFAGAVLGNYVSTAPEEEVLRAFQDLVAWKFAIHGVVNPDATVAYPGKEKLPAIAGHRNGFPTECPGQQLYGQLDTIRDGVRQTLADTAVSSKLTLTTHTSSARADKRVWFDISWLAGGVGVSGRVRLQRKSGSSWVTVREATVRNGVGAVYAEPPADRTYRLRSIASSKPLNVTRVTSSTRSLRVVKSSTNVTMKRAGATRANGEVPIKIEWRVGSARVNGRVAVQYYRSGSWRHARYAKVANGTGSTVLKPSRTQVYRLRGVSATSPSNAVKTHPASTSNEFRVVVS